jgi:hypothetical protein
MKTMNVYASLIVCGCLSLPLTVFAQSNDAAYCAALTSKYAGFLVGTDTRRQRDPQEVSARAGAEQCKAGNTAVGIPLLESSLRNAGLDLPPRNTCTNCLKVVPVRARGG